MVASEVEAGCSVALAYELTEEALQLLVRAGYPAAVGARRSVSEAAFYLSDTFDPGDRAGLVATAAQHLESWPDAPVAHARALLEDVAAEVEHLLRGPAASSELRIGLRALRCAVSELSGAEPSAQEAGGRPLRDSRRGAASPG